MRRREGKKFSVEGKRKEREEEECVGRAWCRYEQYCRGWSIVVWVSEKGEGLFGCCWFTLDVLCLPLIKLVCVCVMFGCHQDPAYVSIWKASILYISRCLTVGKDGREGWPQNGGMPLTKILRATNAE